MTSIPSPSSSATLLSNGTTESQPDFKSSNNKPPYAAPVYEPLESILPAPRRGTNASGGSIEAPSFPSAVTSNAQSPSSPYSPSPQTSRTFDNRKEATSSAPNSASSRSSSPSTNSPGKRSVKKRPGTPGGRGANKALRNFSKEPPPALPTRDLSTEGHFAELRPPEIPARMSFSSTASSTVYPAAPPGLGSSTSFSTPPDMKFGSQPPRNRSRSTPSVPTVILPSPSQSSAMPPPRNIPTPLNLAEVSPSQSYRPVPSLQVTTSYPSPSPLYHTTASPQGSPSQSSSSHHLASSSSSQGQSPSQDRGQTQYVSVPRPGTGSSSLPDSPNTRAMMRRLLSKPAPASPAYFSSSDNESVATYSRRNVIVEERVREQREKAKIEKHHESANDEDTPKPPFAQPRGFELESGSPRDVDSPQGSGELGTILGASLSREKDKGKEREHMLGRLYHHIAGAGYRAEGDGHHSPHKEPRSSIGDQRNKILLSRRRTTNHSRASQYHPPPISPNSHGTTPGGRPRVHALDSLSPTAAIKRCNSVSAVSSQSHGASPAPLPAYPPPRPAYLHPPDRAGGSRSKTASREYSRTPSPNVSTLSGDSGQGRGFFAASASNNSSSKSSPLTPASALVQEYKRQQRIKQDLALRQAKRLSALMWAQEQAKIVTDEDQTAAGSPVKSLKSESSTGSRKAHGHAYHDGSLLVPVDSQGSGGRRKEERLLGVELGRNGASPIDHPRSANSSESGLSYLSPRAGDQWQNRPLGAGFDIIERMFSKDLPVDEVAETQGSPLRYAHQPYQLKVDAVLGPEKELSQTPLPARRSKSSSDHALKREPRSEEAQREEVSSPYYTVFGSTSGRVVAVGSPQDSRDTYGLGYWDSEVLNRRDAVTGGGKKEKSGKGGFNLGRSLSRKVSDRWKKTAGGVASVTDGDDGAEDRFKGRVSMQETREVLKDDFRARWGASTEKMEKMRNRRSIRLSIDKFMDDDNKAELTSLPLTLTRGKMPNDFRSPTALVNNLSQKKKSVGMVKGKSDPIGGSGRKLWKFVKKISSAGGLRDKYHDGRPPVPALPANVPNSNDSSPINQTSHRGSPSSSAVNGSEVLAQLLSSSRRSSMGDESSPSGPNTSNNTPPSNSALSLTAVAAEASTSHRRPVNTRSSSPVSSDHASLKFFNRTHSGRSSTSSFGEDIPPPLPLAPSSLLGQSILSAAELYKVYDQGETGVKVSEGRSSRYRKPLHSGNLPSTSSYPKKTMEGDWTIVNPPSNELPSLPAPPRRPHSVGSIKINEDALFKPDAEDMSEFDDSESPIIPEFSIDNAINAFPARKPPITAPSKTFKRAPDPPLASSSTQHAIPAIPSITSLPPPPRPARNARRPAPSNLKVFELSIPLGADQDSNLLQRPVTSSFGSHHPLSNQNSLSLVHASSPSRSSSTTSSKGSGSTVTFRGMNASLEKNTLTEREKADKWNALLEKSARAGGTLHLAGGGEAALESDRLRLSSTSLEV